MLTLMCLCAMSMPCWYLVINNFVMYLSVCSVSGRDYHVNLKFHKSALSFWIQKDILLSVESPEERKGWISKKRAKQQQQQNNTIYEWIYVCIFLCKYYACLYVCEHISHHIVSELRLVSSITHGFKWKLHHWIFYIKQETHCVVSWWFQTTIIMRAMSL